MGVHVYHPTHSNSLRTAQLKKEWPPFAFSPPSLWSLSSASTTRCRRGGANWCTAPMMIHMEVSAVSRIPSHLRASVTNTSTSTDTFTITTMVMVVMVMVMDIMEAHAALATNRDVHI